MAGLINNLAKKTTPALRFIAASKSSKFLTPLPPAVLHTGKSELTNSSIPIWDSKSALNHPIPQNPSNPSQFVYPSFPYGHIFNPISVAGSDQLNAIKADVGEDCSDDARTLWADSVKKKRKKKMNKHKYKKLRKRLRRKT